MATWPSTLTITKTGFSEKAPKRVIRSEMDVGPAKIRRRSTAAVRNVTLKLFLNDTQLETFIDFFDANDSLAFDFTNPRNDVAERARFVGEPEYVSRDGFWDVSVQLELLP